MKFPTIFLGYNLFGARPAHGDPQKHDDSDVFKRLPVAWARSSTGRTMLLPVPYESLCCCRSDADFIIVIIIIIIIIIIANQQASDGRRRKIVPTNKRVTVKSSIFLVIFVLPPFEPSKEHRQSEKTFRQKGVYLNKPIPGIVAQSIL